MKGRRGEGVHRRVEARAAAHPHAVAVRAGQRELTYRELNVRANQLAHHLTSCGVGPEALVGVCFERSPELLVAILAVLKAGGAYVPLDPAHPPQRIADIVADTALSVLVTSGDLVARLPAHRARLVLLDEDAGAIARSPADDLATGAGPMNLVYCIHTSGSTGRPKAVAVQHASLLNHALHMTKELGIESADRVLQFTPISVDAALEEILPTWIGGATLVLPNETVPTAAQLMRQLHEDRITVLSLPSTYWHHWVDELAARHFEWPAALRLVFVGGERVLLDKVKTWQALPFTRTVELLADYGPTEATISATTFRPGPVSGWKGPNLPIGRPIRDTRVYVLDERWTMLPAGVDGEIYIAGAGLARGYLGQPDLTAERFLPDPFGAPGERMYRTGDIGRVDREGCLHFVGRRDRQVKIRGHRVELAEVESALLDCHGVRQAVVVAHEDPPGETTLRAYVVADDFDEAAVRRGVAAKLPPAMMPAVLLPLPELPISPVNGKVDRARLPVPPAPRPNGHVPAETVESAIVALFGEVLERSRCALDDDFFLGGGDSIRALQLLARLRDATGVEVTLSEFARRRTARALAGELAARTRLDGEVAARIRDTRMRAPALRRAALPRRLASSSQQRLWFLSKLHPGLASYSIPLGYRIRGDFSIERWDAALTTVLARHEALRTGLIMRDGHLWQEVAPPPEALRSKRVVAASFDEALQRARGEARVPFDLTAPPLVRSLYVRVDSSEALVVLNVHHAVFDAWSLAIVWRELAALYAGATLENEAPSFQFGDYSDWQRAWLGGREAEAQRAFWRDRLGGALPPLRLHPTTTREDERPFEGGIVGLTVDSRTRLAVEEAATRYGTTPFVVMLSAFVAVLHRYTRQEEIVVGVPASCRSLPETENVVGYFANTVALRLRCERGLTFAGLLGRTSTALSEALAHQELPFDEVVAALDLPREPDQNPVFQAMFVMQTTPADRGPCLPGASVEEVAVHAGAVKVEVTCAIRTTADGFEGELEYARDVLTPGMADGLMHSLLALVDDAARRTNAPLVELRTVDRVSADAIAAAANRRFDVFSELRPIHVEIEAQSRRTPDAVAVEAGGRSVRYAELNARANRLARRLVAAGAAPESLVGICVDRSIELAVALLAVLKTGAGFVPLDVGSPIERIRTIAADAGFASIVTEERHANRLAALTVPLVLATEGGERSDDLEIPVSLKNVAYVYYTSGSTGVPKGVVIDHRCAMTRLAWLRSRYPLSVGDHVLHKTPLVFDVAIWEMFGPLVTGATVLMADAGSEADVAHLGWLLSRVVFAHFVPSMASAYLDGAAPGSRRYPALRWVQLSGEAVSMQLYERLRQHFAVEVHNLYGQTETSEVAGWEGDDASSAVRAPIGRQVGAYRLFVLDDALQPVAHGATGELFVAGVGGLARGYHDRPELTAERFLPNPYAVEPGERLYRTGDLVRLVDGGALEYLGRVDEQVKVRGCRVETGEVEAILARAPRVRGCAVVAVPDEAGTNELVAYVTGERLAVADLRDHAKRLLPAYMLPATYVVLERLPLTSSGKLDRLRLPPPRACDREVAATDEAPRSPLEEQLVLLWKRVLGVNRLGPRDSFFAAGGNSLRCVQVLAHVKATFGVEISLRSFFAAPTVEALAASVERGLVDLVTSMSDADAKRLLENLEG